VPSIAPLAPTCGRATSALPLPPLRGLAPPARRTRPPPQLGPLPGRRPAPAGAAVGGIDGNLPPRGNKTVVARPLYFRQADNFRNKVMARCLISMTYWSKVGSRPNRVTDVICPKSETLQWINVKNGARVPNREPQEAGAVIIRCRVALSLRNRPAVRPARNQPERTERHPMVAIGHGA
jgi:hypothetical protein